MSHVALNNSDNLSPTLFCLFINDLAIKMKELHCGINKTGIDNVSILLYADDIVLLSDSEHNLQQCLHVSIHGVYNGV